MAMLDDGILDAAFLSHNCMGDFDRDGYCIIPKAISPELCAFVTSYARLKHRVSPNIYKGKDDSLTGIHREYGDALMETFLERLQAPVERATGYALWPTLSFYYTYTRGNELKKHKDRDSCEVVACLCFGSDEAYRQSKKAWPIHLSLQERSVPVHLNQGDIVLFKGNELTHWRDRFEGEWLISAIFAFVRKDSNNAYLKYDQRSYLGRPHIGMFRWSIGYFWANFKACLGRLLG